MTMTNMTKKDQKNNENDNDKHNKKDKDKNSENDNDKYNKKTWTKISSEILSRANALYITAPHFFIYGILYCHHKYIRSEKY